MKIIIFFFICFLYMYYYLSLIVKLVYKNFDIFQAVLIDLSIHIQRNR
jgi:hypothetical protein